MDQTPASTGSGGGTSTRPYLIRALHDWCTDNGFTPYIAVHVDRSVQVPMEYVSNHEIVLNIGFDATSGLDLGNDFIQFKARFGGVAREIIVPVDHVVAIYARENGQGMAFPAPEPLAEGANPPVPAAAGPAEPRRSGLRLATDTSDDEGDDTPPPDGPGAGPRPTLKRVK
ncbi:ClpXP protease specificity-enhancing factor [Pelomonas sp. P7]|uniref:ClpXP protease specificity-enhancing factor n=1 Tax=Pelomonas caseinilytica TaxID=2906763 RepID=A0ABS8XE82_9BURK|nr:ClpXP protease specificity-enhancing factor [Pelomonas sp. P7]MCE4537757.1 ClpXP protease specificity-enhancing factor [Pelomonas sp. P7]